MKLMLPLAAAALAVAAAEDTPAQRAAQLVEALQKKDYAAAAKHFDENLKKALGKDKLAEVWGQVTGQTGELKKVGAPRSEKEAGEPVVFVPCEFAKARFDLRVTFDGKNRISGFRLVPAGTTYKFAPPPYARPDTFREVELTIGAGGDYPLPATLTLPRGDGPFPLVVLVHGSGPHDRDETLGPNKPFRDLAWGLASQGVAVLRYVKRTHRHGQRMLERKVELTVTPEVIEDALAAVALGRKQKGIDPARVFLLGHSLGGYVAPRIAAGDPRLAGVILLAGNSRPLQELIVEQFTYLLGDSEAGRAKLQEIKDQVARLKPDLADDTPAKDLPLGLPPSYWRDLLKYDAPAAAGRLKRPVLVLQGERDYQVTMADFNGWKKALKSHPDATFKSYPALNHLFMPGKGKSTPAEYQTNGHVDRAVIDDIAAWVKRR